MALLTRAPSLLQTRLMCISFLFYERLFEYYYYENNDMILHLKKWRPLPGVSEIQSHPNFYGYQISPMFKYDSDMQKYVTTEY